MGLFNEIFNKNTFYFDIFDKVAEAIYVCDTKTNLIYLNNAAEQLDGYLLKDIKGKSVFKLYGLDEKSSPMLKALVTGTPVLNEKFSYYVNGKKNVQLCNAAPIYKGGKLVGAYTVQRDLTLFEDLVKNEKICTVSDAPKNNSYDNLIGQSKIFIKCKKHAERVAKTDSSVMLVGDTGSGKEIFARWIHENSNRFNGPFLALNCAAIPENLIEGILFGTTKGIYTGATEKEGILAQANSGTIFLDEINSMPFASQAKLLRVLEEKKVMKLGSSKEREIDVRIISSINEPPYDAINKGHIREDLFYRLSVVQIRIPSLHERKEDIPELAQHFVNQYNDKFNKKVLGVDSEVINYFMTFPWPGNVRQLKTCIESAMHFAKDGGTISLGDLPEYVFEDTGMSTEHNRQYLHYKNRITSDLSLSIDKENFNEMKIMDSIWNDERKEIIQALRWSKGNITKAAKSLGISRQLLYYRLKKYHIK